MEAERLLFTIDELEKLRIEEYPTVEFPVKFKDIFHKEQNSYNNKRKNQQQQRKGQKEFQRGTRKQGGNRRFHKQQEVNDEDLKVTNTGELNKAATAWKPNMDKEPSKSGKSFKALLNKLSFERYDEIVETILDLELEREDLEDSVIRVLLRKGMEDHKYCLMYAALATDMCAKVDKKLNFRTDLLRVCEEYFREEIDRKKLDTLEEQPRKDQIELFRFKKVGLMKFMGELFTNGVIPNRVIMFILVSTLKKACMEDTECDEESIKCLIHLVEKTGEQLEKNANKDRVDPRCSAVIHLQKIFAVLAAMERGAFTRYEISTKIKFLIKDLLDCRNNDWVPIKAKEQPMSFKELRAGRKAKRQTLTDVEKQVAQDKFIAENDLNSEDWMDVSGGAAVKKVVASAMPVAEEKKKPAQVATKKNIKVSKDHIQTRTKNILEEYFELGFASEALESFKDEILSPSEGTEFEKDALFLFIETGISYSFEYKEAQQKKLNLLFKDMSVAGMDVSGAVTRWATENFEFLDDIRLDIPYAIKFVGGIYGRFMRDRLYDFKSFYKCSKAVVDARPASKSNAILFGFALSAMQETFSNEELLSVWSECGVEWARVFGNTSPCDVIAIDEFKQRYAIKFLDVKKQ
eukprot:TRINITY_DN775900_c0_g1_i1.p1 TRINITY_DN775900_c0_g1~~TRINITY_DN775900_c0_g1_i1.p1  ORF type:complete len:633 (-),score=211.48 TRINITY_DN775900_c0_g1_i1:111-2009(-)